MAPTQSFLATGFLTVEMVECGAYKAFLPSCGGSGLFLSLPSSLEVHFCRPVVMIASHQVKRMILLFQIGLRIIL